MPPKKLLQEVRRGDFVGEFVAPMSGSDTNVPVLDVYTGRIPDAARAALDGGNVRVYEFAPLPDDGFDITNEPYAIATVGNVHRAEDGHTRAHLTIAVPGAELSAGDTSNPVTEGGARFRRLLEVVTGGEGEHVDELYMESGDTNLRPEITQRLGFQAAGGESEVLLLDLPAAA